MSAFGVFVIILTFIYVCYYATIICMDLFKADKKAVDDEDIFPASESDEEPSKEVSEGTDANGKPVYHLRDKWDEPEESKEQEVAEEEAPKEIVEPKPAPTNPSDSGAAPQPKEDTEDEAPAGGGPARKKMEETRKGLPDTLSETKYQEAHVAEPTLEELNAALYNRPRRMPNVEIVRQTL